MIMCKTYLLQVCVYFQQNQKLQAKPWEYKSRNLRIWWVSVCHFEMEFYGTLYSEKALAPYSSTLAWKIPWMEEPGGLQSMGSLGVRHD